MDLLYRRYADPFSFLSRMVSKYSLADTIKKIWNEAQEEKIFNMYLHSFSDKSFYEYKEEVLKKQDNETLENYNINDEEKEKIVKKSNDILKNFSPLERGI